MLTTRKKIAFTLVTLLFFTLLFIGIEITLRVLYPNLIIPFTRVERYDGIEWNVIQQDFLEKYFSSSDVLIPDFKSSHFRAEKTSNTYRIFAIGGSSMFGTPYQQTANIPGILRKQLRTWYPSLDIEVINLGASAINSHVHRHLMTTYLEYAPDLVIIYMGHNEYYGPEGVNTSWFLKQSVHAPQAYYDFSGLMIPTAVRTLMREYFSGQPSSDDVTLMKQASLGNIVEYGSVEHRRVVGVFEDNLRTIIERFSRKGIPVIVSDIASNLEFPPFIDGRIALEDEKLLREAKEAIQSGNFVDAIAFLSNEQFRDSIIPKYHFLLGSALRKSGNVIDGRKHLVKAKDLDLLKFRAPEEINHAIRRTIESLPNVYFVSTIDRFSAISRDSIPGDSLFWEHLHPTLAGYYEIAQLFAAKILDEKLVENKMNVSATHTKPLPFNLDSLSVNWLDRALADIAIQGLTGNWPFVDYHRTPEAIIYADSFMNELALDLYAHRYRWDEAAYLLASHFRKTGRNAMAKILYETILEEYPTNGYAHYLLGDLYSSVKLFDRAIYHFDRSSIANPDFAEPRLGIGLILVNLAQFDDAMKVFEQALKTTDGTNNRDVRSRILYGIAGAQANKRQFDEALRSLNQALNLSPGYQDALLLKQQISSFQSRPQIRK